VLSDWGQQAWAKSVESPQAKPTYREKYSVPHAAKNPDTIQDCELVTEDLTAMILDPPVQGRSQVLTEPGSLDTSCGDIRASSYEGVATLTTPRGPYAVEGARWHPLSKIFSSAENFKADLEAETLAQESLDVDKGDCEINLWSHQSTSTQPPIFFPPRPRLRNKSLEPPIHLDPATNFFSTSTQPPIFENASVEALPVICFSRETRHWKCLFASFNKRGS